MLYSCTMVNISNLVDGKAAKARRMRLGVSQTALAERVAKISGKKFSQQSLAKFEDTSNSAFTIYILAALDEFERESGVDFLAPRVPPADDVREISETMSQWSLADLEAVLDRIIDDLDREQALEVATRVMQRALALREK